MAAWLHRSTAVAVLAVGVAGCAGSVPLTRHDVYASGVPSRFGYAAGGRDLLTVVIGNPYPISKDAFDAAVVGALQGNNQGSPTRFVTSPSANVRPGYRAVLAIDPPRSLDSKALCGDAAQVRSQSGEAGLRVVMGFCEQTGLLSEAVYVGPLPGSPDSPGFRHIFAALANQFVPSVDPFIELED